MKINRFVGLAVIALLVVGAMGIVTARGLAKIAASHAQQVQVTEAPDNDDVEEQAGDQEEVDNEAEVEDEQEGAESQEQESEGADTDADQAALQGQAKITSQQAQQAALPLILGQPS